MATTKYVVLYGDTDHDRWTVYGTFAASNDKQAISLAIADGLKTEEPDYVGVPLRSWKPRRPDAIETTPRVKFGKTP